MYKIHEPELDMTINTEEYFPQKLALGNHFCNRKNEQKHLLGNIEGARPTLIMSPRRYGKTSLGIYVIEKLKIPYAHLDLFPLANIVDVQNTILGGIGEIFASTESSQAKALKTVSNFFSELSIGFKFAGAKIEVDLMRNRNSSTTILNALKKLDTELEKKRKKAILFLDEFQRLGQMETPETIEGAIRFIAQKSNHIIFIFSGSNRHLLSQIFDDSSRPLYKLCDRIHLNRINREDYVDFINKISLQTKKDFLDDTSLETVLDLTNCHPYYFNVLCSRLWRKNAKIYNEDVLSCWHNYALEEKSTVFKELESLSNNQLKLLIAFSRTGGTESPFGEKFLSLVNMPISSTRQSLKVLQEKDYIYQDPHKIYRILDPLINYILVERPD